MPRSKAPLALVLFLVLLAPTAAMANGRGGGGGGWWEKMSGPGRWWHAEGFYGKCLGEQFCNVFSEDTNWINFSGGLARTGASEDPDVSHEALWVASLGVGMERNVRGNGSNFGILTGAGVKFHRFGGEGVGFWRPSIEPRLSVVIGLTDRVYFQFLYVPRIFLGGYDAVDFGDPTGTFSEGTDVVHSFTFSLGF